MREEHIRLVQSLGDASMSDAEVSFLDLDTDEASAVSLTAATPVVPEPMKGSRMISLGSV